jgi:hypothetical protein
VPSTDGRAYQPDSDLHDLCATAHEARLLSRALRAELSVRREMTRLLLAELRAQRVRR